VELELLEFTLELERNFLKVELELGTFSEGGTLGTLPIRVVFRVGSFFSDPFTWFGWYYGQY
jgi:hypothetical protein